VSIFNLQEFSVKQTISGMKICSDSLLFGAMIPVADAITILDIGAGTGILSLMLAQKANSEADGKRHSITAVELTQEAAEEAQENFSNSPWADQLKIISQDIQQFSQIHQKQQKHGYDLIISNPPFFSRHSKTDQKNPLRHQARHTDTLSFNDLFHSIDLLLTSAGSAYFLLPVISIEEFSESASQKGMIAVERTDIAESEEHVAKVAVMKFVRENTIIGIVSEVELNTQRLHKFSMPNVHSEEAKALLSPFLLRYG
jgi:tRNA1Val (adenine37-N6)-methyltransferase